MRNRYQSQELRTANRIYSSISSYLRLNLIIQCGGVRVCFIFRYFVWFSNIFFVIIIVMVRRCFCEFISCCLVTFDSVIVSTTVFDFVDLSDTKGNKWHFNINK